MIDYIEIGKKLLQVQELEPIATIDYEKEFKAKGILLKPFTADEIKKAEEICMALENEKKVLHNPIYPHTKEDIQNFVNKNCNIIDGSGIIIDENFVGKMTSVQHVTDSLVTDSLKEFKNVEEYQKKFEIKNYEQPKGFVAYEEVGCVNTNPPSPKNQPMTEEDKLQFLNKWFCTDKEMEKILQQEEEALMAKKDYDTVYDDYPPDIYPPEIKKHEAFPGYIKAANIIHNLIKNKKYHEAAIEVEKLKQELTPSEDKLFVNKEKDLYNWCKYYIECYYSYNMDKEKEYPPKLNKNNYYYKTVENITNLLKNNKKDEATSEIAKLQSEFAPHPKKVFTLEEKEVYKWCNYYLDNTKQEITQSKSQEDIVNQQIEQSINKKQQEIIEWCNFYLVPEAAKYVEQLLKKNQYDEAAKHIEQQIKECNSNKVFLGQDKDFLGQIVDTQQVVKELKSGKWGQPYPNTSKLVEKWKNILNEQTITKLHNQLNKNIACEEPKYFDEYNEVKSTNILPDDKDVIKALKKATKESHKKLKAIDWKKFDEETTKKADKMVDDIKDGLKKNTTTMPIEDIIKTLENETKNKKLKKISKSIVCDTPVNITKNPKKFIKKKLSKKDIGNILTDAIVSDKELTKKILELKPQALQPLPKTNKTRRLKSLSDQELNVIKFSIHICQMNIQIPNTSDEKIIVALTKEIEAEETLRTEESQ